MRSSAGGRPRRASPCATKAAWNGSRRRRTGYTSRNPSGSTAGCSTSWAGRSTLKASIPAVTSWVIGRRTTDVEGVDGSEVPTMPEPEIPIERFEVFATGLDHPECVAFDRDGHLWAGGGAGEGHPLQPARPGGNGGPPRGVTRGGAGFPPRPRPLTPTTPPPPARGGGRHPGAPALYACTPAHGLVRVEADDRHAVFATGAGGHAMVCPNYPVFDRRGRLYVSDSGTWKKRNGCLLRFEPDGSGRVIGGPFGYANGLAITADERNLFLVESDTDRVYRFGLTGDGDLGGSEVYAEPVGRLPDGLALDEAGNLYVACYASDEIWRIAPSREKTLLAWDHHAILLGRPTNLAWGGEDSDVLYVANLGRTTITRAHLPGVRGQRLAHQL